MIPPSPEIIYSIILVSFLVAISSAMSGVLMLLVLKEYSAYIKKRFNSDLPKIIMLSAYSGVTFSFITAAFFIFRIAFLLQSGVDYGITDWFAYDLMIGAYMFLMSVFFFTVYNERKHLDSIFDAQIKKKLNKQDNQ